MTTVQEMLDEQDQIMAAAGESGDLTEQQIARYDELDGLIQHQRRTDEIQRRHAAARAAVTPALVTRVGDGPGDEALDRAFSHYLRTGMENADIMQLRAQSESVGTAGGFSVPESFRNRIVDRLLGFGGLQGVVENVVTNTGETMRWLTHDDTSNTGEIVAEGATPVGGADLVLGEANIGAYSYTSNGASGLPLRVSLELLQDNVINLEALIAEKLAMRLNRALAPHLVTGTGVGQPQGILDGITGVEGAAAGAAPTYADLLNWVHSVNYEYRPNARWVFNDASLEMIRGILDTNGRPIVKRADDSIATGAGGETLLGYPVTIDDAFPNRTAASQTINWGVFGDVREGYLFRRVREIQLLVNPYSRMANRQVEYTAWMRADGVQKNTNAYIAMTGFVA